MLDIQVDEDGELRCAACGGKHFTEKRTFRAKAMGGTAGVLTLGVAGAAAPLLAKKKLKCKLCGVYNKTGNAQPYKPAEKPAPARPPRLSDQEQNAQDRIARQRRQGYVPPKKAPPAPPSSREGQFITVKRPMRPNSE